MSAVRLVILSLLLCLSFGGGHSIFSTHAASVSDREWLLTSWHKEHIRVPLRKPRLAVLQADEENVRDEKQAPRLIGDFTIGSLHYDYLPVFSEENQHFLLHYAAAHKGKLGRLYLWHESFLI